MHLYQYPASFLVTDTQYGQSFAAIILVHCQITRITKVDEQFPKAKVIVIDRPTNVWIAFQFSNGIDYGAGSPLCGRGILLRRNSRKRSKSRNAVAVKTICGM